VVDQTRDKARAHWDEMAPAWDRARDYMWERTRHVAEWLVERVQARPGDTILELAGGPGNIGLLAAEQVGPTGKVIETDFSRQMVAMARRRAEELGLSQVETRVIDAERMDLPDDCVDGIICRWGLMLMADPQAALRECRRVLRPDRRLTFSVWGPPEKNPWVTVVGKTMMQLGYEPGGDPFAPGGIFSMAEQGTIERLLADAGFAAITIEEIPVEWSHGSFDEAWSYMSQVGGALSAAVKELPPSEVDELRSALEANTESFHTGSGISLPGLTINVAAV
jgi:ubiquinone/menaquinone biosynthesis C-methylase UbiE